MISEHFVATYQQAGDFEVVNVNGQLKKNGGNLVSYFCTADGRVIHAVGKNVGADQLIQETRWTLDTYYRARGQAPTDHKRQTQLVEKAHLAKLNATPDDFRHVVQRELPQAKHEFAHQRMERKRRGKTYWHRGRDDQAPVPLEVFARRRAAEKLHGDRAHQMLAAEPLPHFAAVSERMFEILSGEKFNDSRWRIESAAAGLAAARERGLPVMLVLYQGHGPEQRHFDDDTKRLFTHTLKDRRVAAVAKSYVSVAIPLQELAALSSVADVPLYEISQKTTPIIVITQPDGAQLAEVSGRVEPEFLAQTLWPPLNAVRFAHAESLADDGQTTDALKILRQLLRSPGSEPLREKVVHRIAEINFGLAEDRATKGKKLDALRLLREIAASDVEASVRAQAEDQIAALRTDL